METGGAVVSAHARARQSDGNGEGAAVSPIAAPTSNEAARKRLMNGRCQTASNPVRAAHPSVEERTGLRCSHAARNTRWNGITGRYPYPLGTIP